MRMLIALALVPALMVLFAPAPSRAQDVTPKDTTLGKAPPEGAVVLLGDGNDLNGWVKLDGKSPAEWPFEDGVMTVGAGTGSIRTQKAFTGDYTLHLEFAVPYMPQARGQGRGNSGVYIQGVCELQILDSYGLEPKDNECGGIYQQYAPKVNACKPPLQWQTYDIEFTAPKSPGGKARMTIRQNDIVIHDDIEVGPTPGGVRGASLAEGPLMLQDHGNAVEFRNIWLLPRTSGGRESK